MGIMIRAEKANMLVAHRVPRPRYMLTVRKRLDRGDGFILWRPQREGGSKNRAKEQVGHESRRRTLEIAVGDAIQYTQKQ
jgi:hypothetical protein